MLSASMLVVAFAALPARGSGDTLLPLHENTIGGGKMAQPQQLFDTGQKSSTPVVMMPRIAETPVFSEFDVSITGKGKVRLDVSNVTTAAMSGEREKIVNKIQEDFNILLARYPLLASALDNTDRKLHIRLISNDEFEGQASGQNVFGNTAYISDFTTFSINLERKVNDYELASAVAFYVFNNYRGGSLDVNMFEFGTYIGPRLFAASLGGKPDDLIDGNSTQLMSAAFISAVGVEGFMKAYINGDTTAAIKSFDAKFGDGSFERLATPPENTWTYSGFLKEIMTRPDFEALKQGIRNAAAKAGYTLGDDLFRP